MKNALIVFVLIILAGIIVFFFFSGGRTEEGQLGHLDEFAHLTLTTYEGQEVSLSDYKGTPLVINSWAVWCPFCRKELPDFVTLKEEFGGDVEVIAVNRQESLEKAKGYTDELGITNNMVYLLDDTDSFYKAISGFSMPETIFVNAAGEIVVHKRGVMDLNEMREHTNKIVN